MIEIGHEEKILRIVRRHWFALLGEAAFIITLLVMPLILMVVVSFLPVGKVLILTGAPLYAEAFLVFTWMFIVWMLGWLLWTDYYLDMLIITDKRIFDIEQLGLFSRQSGSFRMDRIQNVSVEQKGIISTLLNFGTIKIETAGETELFSATMISHPYDVKRLIDSCQDDEVERSQPVHFRAEVAAEIKSAVHKEQQNNAETP